MTINGKIFQTLIEFIIQQNEKGYVNNPKDPGGETKFGISKRWHTNVNITALTIEEAKSIYFLEYWLNIHHVPDISLQYQILDMAINAGVSTANLMLCENYDTISYQLARVRYYMGLKNWNVFKASWLHRIFYTP